MDVEGRASSGKSLTLSIEQDQEKGLQNSDHGPATAHTVDHGNTTSILCPILFTYRKQLNSLCKMLVLDKHFF